MEIIRLYRDSFEHWREGIVALIRESLSASFPDNSIDPGYYEEKCRELGVYIGEDKAVVFLAVEGSELVGFIWCHPIQRFEQARLHVAHLSVFPEWRRKGAGSRLVETAARYAHGQGLDGMELFATASSQQAVSFYGRAGFKVERYLFTKK